MHQLLKRQLRKLGIDPDQVPKDADAWKMLLDRINRTYLDADRDRYTLERSLMLSSEEMAHLYNELKSSSDSALSREKALLSSLINSIPDLIFVKDLQGVYLNSNTAFQSFVDRPAEMISGNTDYDLFPHDLADFFRSQDSKMIESGETRLNEEWVTYPDGSRVLLETLKTPYFGPDNEKLGLIGVSRDITERKQTDNKLRQAAVVFQNTGDSVIITDADANILAVNHSFTEVLGYSEDEVVGINAKMLSSGQQTPAFYEHMWQELNATGHWRGQIWNRHKNKQLVPGLLSISAVEDENGVITNYVGVFTDISDIKRAEDELHYLAHHDPLTGLPNRLLFSDRLQQAIEHAERHQSQFALLFLDIDRFKYINDSLGHSVGDQLLQEIAKRLNQCIRSTDTVARLGGDEYLVILGDISSINHVNKVAITITEAISRPHELRGRTLAISTSIGISMFPQDGADPVTLTKHADTAMYRAKDEGRNRIRFYSPEMTTRASEHLAMENNLRLALSEHQFELYYQPQIDLTSGHITGVEALLRWHNQPDHLLGPEKFLPLSEDTGLILPIGRWVLKEACTQLRDWHRQGFDSLHMSINLSGSQLLTGELPEQISEILESCGFRDTDKIKLELTESVLMKDADAALAAMNKLKSLGLHLSIDDFGTGYSSMSYLKRFPVDELKIDRSFIRDILDDPNDLTIVEATLALGHSFNLEVVAEGVENSQQAALLQKMNCDKCQGYYFSKPVSAKDLLRLLLEHQKGWPL